MEKEIQRVNKKISIITIFLVFSFIIWFSFLIAKKIDNNEKIFEGKYTVSINVSGLEENKYLTGKSDGDYSLALNTGKYEFVEGSFSCSGSYSQQMYYDETSTLELTGITSDISCDIEYKEKQLRVKADCINCSASPEFQYVAYGQEAEFRVYPSDRNYNYIYNTCGAEYIGDNKYVISEIVSPLSCTFAFSDPNYVKTYTLSASSTNPAIGGVTPSSQKISEHQSGTIDIVPKDGYTYKSNNCNGIYSSGKLTVYDITKNTHCSITFTPGGAGAELIVTAYVSNPEGGSLYPAEQKVTEYSSATIILTPSSGYMYSSNSCGAIYDKGVLRINSVIKSTSCKVTYESKQKTVNFTASVNNTDYGSVYPRSQVVNENSTIKLSLYPTEGYAYYANSCNGVYTPRSGKNGTLTIENAGATTNCMIYYADITKLAYVEVSPDDTGHGEISPSSMYVKIGGTAKFNVSSYAGYVYDSNDCSGTYKNGILTITDVKSSMKCNINFKEDGKTYTITMKSNDTSMGEVNPVSRTVTSGDDAQFTYVTKSGYKYLSNDCNAEVSGNNLLIVRAVNANTTCTVTFVHE